ncbi:MAG TPA: sigma-70 family RNA polymerase sigma factor, partial [Kaistiaceae bacterium]|nr:sigma-70 family RNA polymerase sigma factor [Kaistiaceae bacterium]
MSAGVFLTESDRYPVRVATWCGSLNWNRETFADLVEAVAEKRDRAAFATLFDHYTPRLKSYLMRRGASSDLAEELAQDALLTLWTKADQFRPDRSSVGTWLFRIARNRFIDLMRRGIVTAIACNGATAIHDVEAAMLGATSEDVAESIRDGSFGMVRETMDFFAEAVRRGSRDDVGLGRAVGTLIRERKMPHEAVSVFAAAAE